MFFYEKKLKTLKVNQMNQKWKTWCIEDDSVEMQQVGIYIGLHKCLKQMNLLCSSNIHKYLTAFYKCYIICRFLTLCAKLISADCTDKHILISTSWTSEVKRCSTW